MQLKQGDEKNGEASLLSAHEVYTGTLGATHPATGSTLAALANLMRQQQRWPEALPLYESLACMTEEALGPSHPQVGTICTTLSLMPTVNGNTFAASLRTDISPQRKEARPRLTESD